MLETVFMGAVSLLSALIQSVTGFGFGIIMMAVMPLFLPYTSALTISTVLSLALNITILARCWRDISWKQLMLPALFCILGSSAGMFLMANKPSPVYKHLLGVFLVMLAIWLYFFSEKVKLKATMRNAAVAGVISGACGGLFSVSGPPMVLYFVSVIEDKKEYMATLQCYFLLNNIYLLVMRAVLHLLPQGVWVPTLWGAAGLLAGSLAGGKIFNRLDGKKLKSFVYGFMALSGLWIAIVG